MPTPSLTLHDALEAWERAATERLLVQPALHADETGMRVDGKTRWLHIVTDGSTALKFLHRKRGAEAIDDIGVIPRFTGVLVHDCWASCFVYDKCRHGLCGTHLLRELAFVFESGSYRWARLMKKLLREACHRVNKSETRALGEAECLAMRRRYRTILTQGARELPENPKRRKGRHGRIAKSDAHNLHERPVNHEEAVLRFTRDPDVSFTNNAGERGLRMAKVKMKVSGCFRTFACAKRWRRISSYLQSMAALGYNPLVAIEIALAGRAADMAGQPQEPLSIVDA